MNSEFHYYTVYFLALRAGFSDSESFKIAYSSQYVDNALVGHHLRTSRGLYETTVTQNYGWWDNWFPVNVYLPFHFFPGDHSRAMEVRKSKNASRYVCTPDSPMVKELLVEGLKTRNPYRVGIAVHTYADSWAHQNFSGVQEDCNELVPGSGIPSIGHAQALKNPDQYRHAWTDSRLIHEEIRNDDRFFEAAEKIYRYFRTYLRKDFSDSELIIMELSDVLGRGRTMEERLLEFSVVCDIPPYSKKEWENAAFTNTNSDAERMIPEHYDKLAWVRDTLFVQTRLFPRQTFNAAENFYETDLYYWNEAAREHRNTALGIIKRHGLALP